MMTLKSSNSYNVAERVNSDVNASVTYKTDLEQYDKPDFWVEAGTFGDCEDYALRKRELLLNAGFAPKDLHLA
jgi:predicted transglutaminase-like cysteine proteinase